jgi:hypothetical protein
MKINGVTEYHQEINRNQSIKQQDIRHTELRLEEQHKKQIKENDEATRIEMNRRMNRPGQNIDRMA